MMRFHHFRGENAPSNSWHKFEICHWVAHTLYAGASEIDQN